MFWKSIISIKMFLSSYSGGVNVLENLSYIYKKDFIAIIGQMVVENLLCLNYSFKANLQMENIYIKYK